MSRTRKPAAAEPPFSPRMVMDIGGHVALEYARRRGVSKYLCFGPSGLRCEERGTEAFEREFRRPYDKPLKAAALRFIELNHSAYLPDPRANPILMEVYMNAIDLGTADLKSLVAHYNELAKAAGKGPVKGFKSKGEAVKRIEALSAEAVKPSDSQEAHREERARAAAARFESLKAAKAESKPVTKSVKPSAAAKVPTKSVAPAKKPGRPAGPKKPEAEKKPRGHGIGAFCMELLRQGKSNAEVLEAVAKRFPEAKTSAASVSWYRNKIASE